MNWALWKRWENCYWS